MKISKKNSLTRHWFFLRRDTHRAMADENEVDEVG